MHSRCCYLLFCLVAVAPVNLVAAQSSSFFDRYAAQREIYLQLTETLKAGSIDSVKARAKELEGYPLKDYLDYLILKQEIKRHPKPAALLPGIDEQKRDKRLQRRLLGAAKNRSVELARWQDYATIAVNSNAPVHPCDDLLSKFKTGQSVRFSQAVADLWGEVSKHTRNCDEAFSLLLDSVADVPTGALWRRTVAFLQQGDTGKSKELLHFFNKRDRSVVEAWIEGIENPHKVLPSEVIHGHSSYHREMATMLLQRWARKDLVAATEFWRNNAQRFGFSNKSIDETLARYAVLAAKRGMPESAQLLNNVKPDRDVRFWRIRQALLKAQWEQCIVYLDALTDNEQAQARWRYWRARCLESQGFKSAAERGFKTISDQFSFYGFLAADRLSKSYSIEISQPLVSEAEVSALRQSDDITRAIEYFLVGLPWEGRREWNRWLKSASKKRYIAAAHVAESLGWHDRALVAMQAAGESTALSILYPAAHVDTVREMSDQFSIGRDFIYGVMRRESRFISDIRSPAGAVGLMQLMPATAKQVGKQLGISAPRWKLINSELNIKLGTKYLNHLMKRFDGNMVLSTAAYNAGPTRVGKWMLDKPISADVWIETIPYDETRAYVKAVLFNSVVFEAMLAEGKPVRLKDKMPDPTPPQ